MFTFGIYNLRATVAEDAEKCREWIEADKFHRGKCKPEFFIAEEPEIEKFVLEIAATGQPQFYFRMTRALRVDIQFGPSETKEEREQNRDAMMFGFEWLLDMAQKAGYREMLFQTDSPLLANFVQRRIGFVASQGEQVRAITAPQV